jgi:hypothetical protein
MTPRSPENFWSLITIGSNTISPRDPNDIPPRDRNDDNDEDEEDNEHEDDDEEPPVVREPDE